jgi:hypothetical protein
MEAVFTTPTGTGRSLFPFVFPVTYARFRKLEERASTAPQDDHLKSHAASAVEQSP